MFVNWSHDGVREGHLNNNQLVTSFPQFGVELPGALAFCGCSTTCTHLNCVNGFVLHQSIIDSVTNSKKSSYRNMALPYLYLPYLYFW